MKSKLGHRIAKDLKKAFDEHVNAVGGKSCFYLEGAIKAYLSLPEPIQDQLQKPRCTLQQAKKLIEEHWKE